MSRPKVPSNHDEYLMWHLEGYDIGNLMSSINSDWVVTNFSWLHQHNIINRIQFVRDALMDQSIINIFIDNAVATYNGHDPELFERAYRTIAHYAPEAISNAM